MHKIYLMSSSMNRAIRVCLSISAGVCVCVRVDNPNNLQIAYKHCLDEILRDA